MSTQIERASLPVACPTCGAVGTQVCVRGRKPSAIWQQQQPYPQMHDSRITANNSLGGHNG
jgi:hypothetical protein